MADDELLRRLDEHMARGNTLMGDIREEMRLSRRQHEESTVMFADLRVFMREITLRVERGGREQVAALRELREGTRAQTRALLTVIDRMDRIDPGGAAPGR